MNKEVEEAKEWLKDKREYYRARMKDYEKDNCLTAFYYEIKKDETIMKTILNYIQELEDEIHDLKVIEEAHQEENGKLRTELDKKEREIRRHHREIAKGLQKVFEECLGGNDNE